MNYYLLTDEMRKGLVILEDGRKHFRFVFGRFEWERTTIFQAYLTEGTVEFGKYRTLTEEAAMAALSQLGKSLNILKEKAQKYAEATLSGLVDQEGRLCSQHTRSIADNLGDWDEAIAAWLYGACDVTSEGVKELRLKGYPLYICTAVECLRRQRGDSFEAYLKKVRMNRIARNVKLTELSYYMTVLEAAHAASERMNVYRHGRQFLHGDIPTMNGEEDPMAFCATGKQFVSSEEIFKNAYGKALGGRKIPHGLSNPVLRYVDGKLSLAFFVYTYNKNDLQNKSIGRPCAWMVADVENGMVVHEISCSAEDFSKAPMEAKYSMEQPGGGKNRLFYSEAYGILDTVRREYVKTGILQEETYRRYLDEILKAVPSSYHCFYRELSL